MGGAVEAMKWINRASLFLSIFLLSVAGILIVLGLKNYYQGKAILQQIPTPIINVIEYYKGVELVERGQKFIYTGLSLGALAQPESHELIYRLVKGQKPSKRVIVAGGTFIFFGFFFLIFAL